MILVILGAFGMGLYLYKKNSETSQYIIESESVMNRIYNLKDVSIGGQSGGYKRDYDFYFMEAADEFKVPFALLKAHAIKESSLNPKAYLDENPKRDTAKNGWASRGLMQLLWANDKLTTQKLYDRFKKYGYSGDVISYSNGDLLFDVTVNLRIAAQLIRDNLQACGGNIQDAINMYNTGVKYSVRQAPGGYTEKVVEYYKKILGEY